MEGQAVGIGNMISDAAMSVGDAFHGFFQVGTSGTVHEEL